MSAKGYVYILTNPCFDVYFKSKIVKIGQAKDVEKRRATLNTAVPKEFEIYATLCSSKYKIIEKKVHQRLRGVSAIKELQGQRRVKAENGEFYLISPAQAVKAIKEEAELVDESDKVWTFHKSVGIVPSTRNAPHRGPFNFAECGIKPGSKIRYTKDKSIEAIVVDERRVQYKDETMSVSALAKLLMNITHSIQGTKYFEYEGENLDELRTRLGK